MEHFEDHLVEILLPEVKPEFALLQAKVKSVLCQASEAHQPGLGIAPEALNAIDKAGFRGELILAVLDPEELLVPVVQVTSVKVV